MTSVPYQGKMTEKFNQINKEAYMIEAIKKMEERLPTTLEYMDHLKSVFFCSICGYNNQQFIDTENKTVTFSAESCDSMVRNTFQFSYLLNNVLVTYLMKLSEFISVAMQNKAHPHLKIRGIELIKKKINTCAEDYKDNDDNLNNCLDYCSFFKLNRNTPQIEGYHYFLAMVIHQIDVFVASGGTIVEKKSKPAEQPKKPAKEEAAKDDGSESSESEEPGDKAQKKENTDKKKDEQKKKETEQKNKKDNESEKEKDDKKSKEDNDEDDANKSSNKENDKSKDNNRIRLRVLEEILSDIDYTHPTFRILSEDNNPEANKDNKEKDPKKEGEGEGEDKANKFIDVFDFNNFAETQNSSIYETTNDNEYYGEEWTQMLVTLQQEWEKNRPEGMDVMMRKFIEELFKVEMDDIDGDIFSTPTDKKVHVHKYKTKFGHSCISFTEEMKKVDWNMSLRTLVASMQGTDDKAPSNDHLDINILRMANRVTNKILKDFHQDNYLKFKHHDLHRRNHVLKNLHLYMIEKNAQKYAEFAVGAVHVVHNVSGPEEAAKLKGCLKREEERFAKKILRAIDRIFKRLDNSDLKQLEEIEDKIASVTLPELIQLQKDMARIKELCPKTDAPPSPFCVEATKKLANVFDLDANETGFEEVAKAMADAETKNKVDEIMKSPELVQKEIDKMKEVRKECEEKLKANKEDPKCNKDVNEVLLIFQVPKNMETLWKDLETKAAEMKKAAEEFKKKGEVSTGDEADSTAGAPAVPAEGSSPAPNPTPKKLVRR